MRNVCASLLQREPESRWREQVVSNDQQQYTYVIISCERTDLECVLQKQFELLFVSALLQACSSSNLLPSRSGPVQQHSLA